MPAERSIEERLAIVEEAIAELQRRLLVEQPATNWLDRIIGSFKDDPAFEEVIALGRAYREADRPADDQDS